MSFRDSSADRSDDCCPWFSVNKSFSDKVCDFRSSLKMNEAKDLLGSTEAMRSHEVDGGLLELQQYKVFDLGDKALMWEKEVQERGPGAVGKQLSL